MNAKVPEDDILRVSLRNGKRYARELLCRS